MCTKNALKRDVLDDPDTEYILPLLLKKKNVRMY